MAGGLAALAYYRSSSFTSGYCLVLPVHLPPFPTFISTPDLYHFSAQRQQLSPPLDTIDWTMLTRGLCKRLKIAVPQAHGMCQCSDLESAWSTESYGTGDCFGHNATIHTLPDDILLEILAFCIRAHNHCPSYMANWNRLTHVCQRWRQIVYESPRHLGVLLYFTNNTSVKNLSFWPTLPIALSYRFPTMDYEKDVIALLEHRDRVHVVDVSVASSHSGTVFAAMQGSFPMLTHLELSAHPAFARRQLVLPSGFLGGSARCLRQLSLSYIAYPELPTLLSSARHLVSLQLNHIPPTGYISPEAMVSGLAGLTKLRTLCIKFYPPASHHNGRKHRDSLMRASLPALTEFEFSGWREYMDDLVALTDAPQLHAVITGLQTLDSLRAPRISLLIRRAEDLSFMQAKISFIMGQEFRVEINRRSEAGGPPNHLLNLATMFDLSDASFARVVQVLSQLLDMFPHIDDLNIYIGIDYPHWQENIDNTEWLAFLLLFTTVERLEIYGRLAGQVAHALEEVPEEMVTEVLPSLQQLVLQDMGRFVDFPEQFFYLRHLCGRPVTIYDKYKELTEGGHLNLP